MTIKRQAQLKWVSDNYWLAIVVPSLLILIITFLSYQSARQEEMNFIEQSFQHDAKTSISELEQSFAIYVNTLFSIKSFYESSEFVSREEFRTFTTFGIREHPGILALAWAPIVSSDQREQFEQSARGEGLETFQFKKWTGSEWLATSEQWATEYFPVFYAAPNETGNGMGIDFGTDPVRRQAIEQARMTGSLTATSPILLLNNKEQNEVGLLLFLPVNDPQIGDVVGFISGVFRFEDVIQTSLPNLESKRLLLQVSDITDSESGELLISQINNNNTSTPFKYVDTYEFGGRVWQATVVAAPNYLKSHQTGRPTFILIGGIIIAAMIGAIIWGVGLRIKLVEEMITKSNELEVVNADLIAVSAKLTKSKARLERNNQELRQFAYVASHDLQEPLRAVSSYIQLLSRRYKGELDDDADEFIDFAVDGTLRMKQLINDLLTYSRLDRLVEEMMWIDLNGVVDIACQNLSMQVEETSAVISYEDLPTVWGSQTLLVQLFQNLISNGIKFQNADNQPQIIIEAQQEFDRYLLTIMDNGIGFDNQYSDRIFKIFQRLHNQEVYSGTGIGLAICRKVIERHNGRIWVESTLGGGTTFYFTLPSKKGQTYVEPIFEQTNRNLVS